MGLLHAWFLLHPHAECQLKPPFDLACKHSVSNRVDKTESLNRQESLNVKCVSKAGKLWDVPKLWGGVCWWVCWWLESSGNVFLQFSTKHIEKLSCSANCESWCRKLFLGVLRAHCWRKHARGAFLWGNMQEIFCWVGSAAKWESQVSEKKQAFCHENGNSIKWESLTVFRKTDD